MDRRLSGSAGFQACARRRRHAGLEACATLITCCLLATASLAGPPTVRDLYDWSQLPSVAGPRLVEATNTRGPKPGVLTDAAPGQTVLLDAAGPGCLVRLSIAGQTGQVKIYLDGAAAPQVDIAVKDLHPIYAWWEFWQPEKFAAFDKDHPQVFPFLAPLCSSAVAWQNWCLVPIPFARSARVILEHAPGQLGGSYSVLWERLPAGGNGATYSAEAMRGQAEEVWKAARAWRVPGQRPCSYPNEQRLAGKLAIPAQGTVDLRNVAGGGTMVSLRLKATPWNQAIDRRLVLRAYWDGEARPSVEAPLGELCNSEAGAPAVNGLAVGRKDGWYYLYLPLPYANGAHLTLQNYSRYPIPSLEWEIITRPGAPAPEAGRFCARWKRVRRVGDDGVYELLNATGAGKLVGYNLYIDGFQVPMPDWNRPGRMAFYADGETEPAVAGRALLMYWYEGVYGGPNSSPPLMATPHFAFAQFGNFGAWRTFLTDAPNWMQSGRLQMEVKRDEISGRDFTSVASWYRAVDGKDNLPDLKPEDLALPVFRYPGAIPATDLVKTARMSQGDLLVVDDSDGRYGVENNAYVSYAPLGTGDWVTFTFPVEKAGKYTVGARLVAGPSGGFWSATVNGVSADPKQQPWGCVSEETQVAGWLGWFPLGTFDLHAGNNQVTFTARAAYVGARSRGRLLGLDGLLLTEGR